MTKTFLIASMMTMALTSANAVKISMVNDDKDFRWGGWVQNLDPTSIIDEKNLKVCFSIREQNGVGHDLSMMTASSSSSLTLKTPAITSVSFDAESLVDHKIETLHQEIAPAFSVQPNDHIEFRLKLFTNNPIGLFYTLSNVTTPSSPVILASRLPKPSLQAMINDIGGDYANAQDNNGDSLQDSPLSKFQRFKKFFTRR